MILGIVVIFIIWGCGTPAPSPDGGPAKRVLRAEEPGPDVGLSRGSQKTLSVKYALVGEAETGIAGEEVRFAIYGDPRGSTLSADTAVTDGSGSASVQVRAGAASSRFQVRVSARDAEDITFYIEVSDAGFGSLLVSGAYPHGAVSPLALERVEYSLYGNIACTSINPVSPPPSLRTRSADAVDKQVALKALPLNLNHTISALAFTLDSSAQAQGWRLRATGCITIPPGVLKEDRELAVSILLVDLMPNVEERYELISKITLPKANRPLVDAVQPYKDIADCPLDPAQLMLDCILDAIDPGDALDCKVTAPSGKTQALMAERGELTGPCRGKGKNQTLEELLVDAMTPATTTMITTIRKVESRAADVLTKLGLKSTLEIESLSSSGDLVASHHLEGITFFDGKNQVTYDVGDVGLPKWLAIPVHGIVDPKWKLGLSQHGFTLRYGLVAHKAHEELVLAPLGLKPKSSDMVAELAAGITVKHKGIDLTGCPAIDVVVCEAARLGAGCLGQACTEGLAALAAYLDSGFEKLDLHDTDFTLEGEAELKDNNGDLTVDGLGDEKTPGTWKAKFYLGMEVIASKEATFQGILKK